MVQLQSRVVLDDGRVLPADARGAVVAIWAAGEAYEVEFVEPFPVVVTVTGSKLSEAA